MTKQLTNNQHEVKYAETWHDIVYTDLEWPPHLAGEVEPPDVMPETRAGCKDRKWRCAFLGCRHHNASGLTTPRKRPYGRKNESPPQLKVTKLRLDKPECSLDIADAIQCGAMDEPARIVDVLLMMGICAPKGRILGHNTRMPEFWGSIAEKMRAAGIDPADIGFGERKYQPWDGLSAMVRRAGYEHGYRPVEVLPVEDDGPLGSIDWFGDGG